MTASRSGGERGNENERDNYYCGFEPGFIKLRRIRRVEGLGESSSHKLLVGRNAGFLQHVQEKQCRF